jgi:carbonic anhydrase
MDQSRKDHVILDVPSLGLLKARFNGLNINYKAKEIHVNAPSEHKVDGVRHDMEVHIHHENEDGTKPDNHFAVVSLLFKKAEQGHPVIDKIQKGTLVDFNKDIFNNEKGFFYYSGTHTAPPSVDHVNWFLLSRVLPVTASQLRYLQDHWHEKHGFTNFRIT